MAKVQFKNGVTSVVLRVKLMDSTSTTGASKTGLTSSSSGLIVSTIADVEASATAYTAAGATIDSITTLGTFAAPSTNHCRFKEVDATNHPGVYEIQLADARWAVSGARSVIVTVLVSGAAQIDAEVQLTSVDPYDAVRGGMTALPNANAAASGGLPTAGTGTNQISLASGAVLVQSGTGSGQISLSSGAVLIQNGQLFVKKNVNLSKFMFTMFTSGGAGATGLSVTAQRAIDGGSFATMTNNPPTEIGSGWYWIDIAAADVNGTVIALKFTASGALDTDFTVITQP